MRLSVCTAIKASTPRWHADGVVDAFRARGVHPDRVYQVNVPTPERMSPEALTDKGEYDRSLDMLRSSIESRLPDPDGTTIEAFLDYEPHTPFSLTRFMRRDPGTDVAAWGAFMRDVLETAREMRPDVRWGWWGLPRGTTIPGPADADVWMPRMDELLNEGVFEGVGFLMPSFNAGSPVSFDEPGPGEVSAEDYWQRAKTWRQAIVGWRDEHSLTESLDVLPSLWPRYRGGSRLHLIFLPAREIAFHTLALKGAGFDRLQFWFGVNPEWRAIQNQQHVRDELGLVAAHLFENPDPDPAMAEEPG